MYFISKIKTDAIMSFTLVDKYFYICYYRKSGREY